MASRRGRGSGAGPWEGRIRDGSPALKYGGRLHGSVSGDRDELHQSVRGWLACLKKGAYRHPEVAPPKWPGAVRAEPGGRAPFGAGGAPFGAARASFGAAGRRSQSREVVTSRRVPVEGGKLT